MIKGEPSYLDWLLWRGQATSRHASEAPKSARYPAVPFWPEVHCFRVPLVTCTGSLNGPSRGA